MAALGTRSPLVSVVIPAWNASAWLAETLDSVLRQTWPALEVIVVDDGSSDDTAAVAARFAPAVQCIRVSNGGQARARNIGMQASTGAVIALLDSDDLWRPNKTEAQLDLLLSDDRIGLVFCDYDSFGAIAGRPGFTRSGCLPRLPVQAVSAHGRVLTAPDLAQPMLDDMYCQIPSTWLCRRSVLADAGRFDETLTTGAEDWLFAVRIAMFHRIGYDARRLALRRERDGSSSRSHDNRLSQLRALQRLGEHDDLNAALRAAVESRIASQAYHLADAYGPADPRCAELRRLSLRHASRLPRGQRLKLLLKAAAQRLQPRSAG